MRLKNVWSIFSALFIVFFVSINNAESLTVAGIEFADNAFVDRILSTDFTGTCGYYSGHNCSTLYEALVGADLNTWMEYGDHDLLPGEGGDYNSTSPPVQYVEVGFTDNAVYNESSYDIAIFELGTANSVLVALDRESIQNPYASQSNARVINTVQIATEVNVGYLDLADLGVASGQSIDSLFISSPRGRNGEIYWNTPGHENWGVPEVAAIGALHTGAAVIETVYELHVTLSPISESQIDLEWSMTPHNPDVAGYTVYRDDVRLETVTGTAYSDENLSPSTTYNYIVQAVDPDGNVLAESLPVGATTLNEQDTPDPIEDDPIVGGNHAPEVDAGDDIDVDVSERVELYGLVEDDGLPEGMMISVEWSCVSGDAEAVTFDAPTSANSSVIFDKAGTYVLRLEASDGDLTASDTIEVKVEAAKDDSGSGGGCFINSISY